MFHYKKRNTRNKVKFQLNICMCIQNYVNKKGQKCSHQLQSFFSIRGHVALAAINEYFSTLPILYFLHPHQALHSFTRRVSHIFVSEGFVAFVILPELCCSFLLTLNNQRYDNINRCPKVSPALQI